MSPEARLLTIEEGRVPTDGVVIKRLAPVRVAELTGTAASFEPEAITPVIHLLTRRSSSPSTRASCSRRP